MSRLSVADVEHAGFKPLVKAETLALERTPVKHADVQAAGFKPLTKASTFTGACTRVIKYTIVRTVNLYLDTSSESIQAHAINR